MASRLSEAPSCSVLLLEAGQAYTPDTYPDALKDISGNTVEPQYIWGYQGAVFDSSVLVAAFYGAQTARAVENFPISSLRLQRPFLRALGLIKAAAARVNGRPSRRCRQARSRRTDGRRRR